MNEMLLNQLWKANVYYSKLNEKEKEINAVRNRMQALKNGFTTDNVPRIKSAKYWIGFGISMSFAQLCAMLLLFFIDNVIVEGIIVLSALCVCGVSLGIVFSKKALKCRKENARLYEEALESYKLKTEPEIAKAAEQLRYLIKLKEVLQNEGSELVEFLPEDYRNQIAVYYMWTYVKNYRADTLKEALNLFEAEKERMNREQAMKNIMNEMQNVHSDLNRVENSINQVADSVNRTADTVNNLNNKFQ